MLYSFFLKNLVVFIFLILVVSLLIGLEVYRYYSYKFSIEIKDVLRLINNSDGVMIDLRNVESFKKSHIINSINIPLSRLNKNLNILLPYKKKIIILIHDSNYEVKMLLKLLDKNGNINVKYFSNGLDEWARKGYPFISNR